MFKFNFPRHFILKTIMPLLAGVMFLFAVFGLSKIPKKEAIEPVNPVSISPFAHSVSGLGATEPRSEIINIGTNFSGIVTKVYVKAGDEIEPEQPLFTIDDREAEANFYLKTAQYKAASIDAEDKIQEFERYKKIADQRAYSADEFNKKKFAAEIFTQKAEQAKADMEVARVVKDKLTIKSPIDGEVLKVDIRAGEFAQAGIVSKPLMMIGDLSIMHVRVEFDESDVNRIKPENPAFGLLRGRSDIKIPLKFVRFEPYVVPKVSLSGGNAEKIDTRVLQAIYSFENSFEPKILVGQQIDVYVEEK